MQTSNNRYCQEIKYTDHITYHTVYLSFVCIYVPETRSNSCNMAIEATISPTNIEG